MFKHRQRHYKPKSGNFKDIGSCGKSTRLSWQKVRTSCVTKELCKYASCYDNRKRKTFFRNQKCSTLTSLEKVEAQKKAVGWQKGARNWRSPEASRSLLRRHQNIKRDAKPARDITTWLLLAFLGCRHAAAIMSRSLSSVLWMIYDVVLFSLKLGQDWGGGFLIMEYI